MGAFVHDSTALSIQTQMNERFGAGDPIQEIAALNKEFKLFSGEHSLRWAFSLLHITPPVGDERERWYKYLETLKRVPSDREGVNGHDRILQAIQENLVAKTPLPMRLTVHAKKDNPQVTVKTERAIVFSKQDYVVVSVPTQNGREARMEIAQHVRKTRLPARRRKPTT